MAEPVVTVLISPREGHFMSEASLRSVLADDAVPFALLYVDIASPPPVAQAIRALAAEHGFKVLRHDDWIAPALARKQALAEVATEYVAFVDNDVLVEPGCLETLLDCAEETGAGLVCPLYIQAGGGRAPTIHMAGGQFVWSEDDGGVLIGEHHRLAGQPVGAAAGLARARADYTEYHYVLGRMDLLRRPEAISEEILLVHEHLDLGLVAREQGLAVYVEPAARATYVAFEPRPLSDLAFYRRRWDEAECRKSVLAFADRRLGEDRGELVDKTFDYIAMRRHQVELRRRGSAGADLAEAMARTDLAQNRCALREQALGRGYGEAEVLAIEEAADFATLLFDGLYRPDGRPFLSHVIGTASALVRFELELDIVRAGLLHAAFTHRPDWIGETELSATLARTPKVARLVLGQPQARAFLAQDGAEVMDLNLLGAGVACMLAANEADMRLAGEYRATGRPAEMPTAALERIGVALAQFGVEGLARSAGLPAGEGEAWPLLGAGVRQSSFRLDAKNRRLIQV